MTSCSYLERSISLPQRSLQRVVSIIARNVVSKTPFMSSSMDTVIENEMAIAMVVGQVPSTFDFLLLLTGP